MTESLAVLLGTVVTTLGGIFVLWLNQRNEFRKAAQQRRDEREAAAVRAAVLAEKMAATNAVLVEKVDSNNAAIAETASAISDKVDDTSQRISGQVVNTARTAQDWADKVTTTALELAAKNEAETKRKHELLADIQQVVNGRLEATITQVTRLTMLVQELIDRTTPKRTAPAGKIVKRAIPKAPARRKTKGN